MPRLCLLTAFTALIFSSCDGEESPLPAPLSVLPADAEDTLTAQETNDSFSPDAPAADPADTSPEVPVSAPVPIFLGEYIVDVHDYDYKKYVTGAYQYSGTAKITLHPDPEGAGQNKFKIDLFDGRELTCEEQGNGDVHCSGGRSKPEYDTCLGGGSLKVSNGAFVRFLIPLRCDASDQVGGTYQYTFGIQYNLYHP